MYALANTCPEPEPRRERTILVAEDEVLIRDAIAQHLRSHGFRVIEAANAAEAMDALRSGEQIDLLFTDVSMPGVMNGVMLARWVQQNHAEVTVVLASGQKYDGRALPDHPLFLKPYDPDAVEAHIRRALAET
ncbi:MAG: response regulator [Rhizomicrobium sp.]